MYKIAEVTTGFNYEMAYPQYKNHFSQQDVISVNTWGRLQEYAQNRLNERTFGGNVKVREHMIQILDGIVPFNMRIVSEDSFTAKL